MLPGGSASVSGRIARTGAGAVAIVFRQDPASAAVVESALARLAAPLQRAA